MKIYVLVGALIALLAPPVAVSASDVPTVVRTAPASGAVGVDPTLRAVEVWFSEDMRPGSMSLIRADGAEKLGYRDDARPYFEGPRHLVIPVRLRPGTTYGVGINGPGKDGFQSVGGVPAAPYLLRFTTVGGTPPAGPSPSQAPSPAGRWRLARVGSADLGAGLERQLEIHIFDNGAWGCLTTADMSRIVVAGTWRVDDAREDPGRHLVLSHERSEATMMKLLPMEAIRAHMLIGSGDDQKLHPDFHWVVRGAGPFSVDRTTLRLGPQDGRALYFEPLPPLPSGALAGTWTSFGDGAVDRVWELKPDGTAQGSVGQTVFRGRWNRGPMDLEVDAGDQVARVKGPWVLAPADGEDAILDKLIVFTEEPRDVLVFKRAGKATPKSVPAPAAVPAGIVGRWSVQTDEGLARLEFKSDGTYVRTFGAPTARVTVKGTWRVVGSALQVHDEEDNEDLSVPFVLVNENTLRLTIDGTPVDFTRDGSTARPVLPTAPTQPPPPQEGADEEALALRALVGSWRYRALDPLVGEVDLTMTFGANGQWMSQGVMGGFRVDDGGSFSATSSTIVCLVRRSSNPVIRPGATQTLSYQVTATTLQLYDQGKKQWVSFQRVR